jgi:hypothetical protein
MDRHVLPIGGPVMLDESGFLDAAMATAWWVAPEDRPLPVTELCGQAGSFVLLAADGTGKTTVLRSLRGREPGSVEVNLSALGKSSACQLVQPSARPTLAASLASSLNYRR